MSSLHPSSDAATTTCDLLVVGSGAGALSAAGGLVSSTAPFVPGPSWSWSAVSAAAAAASLNALPEKKSSTGGGGADASPAAATSRWPCDDRVLCGGDGGWRGGICSAGSDVDCKPTAPVVAPLPPAKNESRSSAAPDEDTLAWEPVRVMGDASGGGPALTLCPPK
jgi:hypothetical protein